MLDSPVDCRSNHFLTRRADEPRACALCQARRQQYRLVGQSELAFCVVNLEFLVAGHVMVLPKRHCTRFAELRAQESAELLALTESMAQRVRKSYALDPLVVLNTGLHRSEAHLHFHIVPSRGGCRDRLSASESDPTRVRRSPAELRAVTRRLQLGDRALLD